MNVPVPSQLPGSKKCPALILLIVALAPLFLTGCKTSSKTSSQADWDSRVGRYTYDQAVAEMGKPQTTQVQPDGTRVAEWLTQKGRPPAVEYGLNPGYAVPGVRQSQNVYETSEFPLQYLRLTFAPDGTLKSWRQTAK
jgi:hypothetical protein